METGKTITIVGIGLIGGSLGLHLRQKALAGRLIGVDTNPEHAAEALKLGLVDEVLPLEQAIAESDAVLLTIPVDALVKVLPQVLDLADEQVVLDFGSTKGGQLAASVANHSKRGRYVATHPMWGTEFSGPSAAVADSFTGRVAVLCDLERSDADAVSWARELYSALEMKILELDSDSHDLHVAYISHISHITSFALANAVLEKEKQEQRIFDLASGGFESTVRLAKSNAAMWAPIFIQNKENVLDVLQENVEQLLKFQRAIEAEDAAELKRLIESANQIAKVLSPKS
jgi:prephenate dehydrogenase